MFFCHSFPFSSGKTPSPGPPICSEILGICFGVPEKIMTLSSHVITQERLGFSIFGKPFFPDQSQKTYIVPVDPM
jgi:hypothetical protein